MDAQAKTALAVMRRVALGAVLLLVSMGARQRSANFVVETADPQFATQVAQAAEQYRHDLAIEWLGQAMPNWAQPCVMTVQAAPNLGAGGATTFVFDRGEVFGWRMTIQGSRERVLDSVLPHEITHMIFASHFRQPLPRWADEGGATTVEHASERFKYRQMLYQFLRTGHGIAFNQMFAMTEYPADIMPLYAQGYSLAEYLIQTGGRRRYVEFMGDGLQTDDWTGAVDRHYGVKDLGVLQNTWLAWVAQGSPPLQPRDYGAALLADGRRARPEPNLIYRVRDKQTNASTPLVPVHIPAEASGTVTPTVMAAAASRGESKVLPAAGWRAAGSPERVEPASYPSRVAHPQPPEEPRERILR